MVLLVTFLDCGPGVCFSPTGDLMGAGLMMFYDGLMSGFTDAIYGNAVKVLGGNIQVHAEGLH